MEVVKDVVRRVVNDRSVKRAFWTVVEVAAGAVAYDVTGKAGVAVAVGFVALAVKEAAVRRLAS